jgi:cytochrome c oxidase subunit 2
MLLFTTWPFLDARRKGEAMADMRVPGQAPASAGLRFGPLGRLMLWLGIISAAFIVLVIVAPISPWFPEATREAGEVDNLFKFMLAASGVIFIYVQGLLLAFALRYRRRKKDPDDAVGPAIHGHTGLETAWSAVPALLLLVLVVLSLRVWSDEHSASPPAPGPCPAAHSPFLLLCVRGFQFGWTFSLPQYGLGFDKSLSTAVIPVNRPVYVYEQSHDVIHSFWVPAFRIKQDVVPGLTTYEEFTPTRTGTYNVICTEFCGSGHSGMVTTLRVASQADFVTWLRKNGATRLPTGHALAALVQP